MKKKKFLWMFVLILVLVGAFVYFGFSQTSIGDSNILIPFYGTLKCDLASTDVTNIEEIVPNDDNWYYYACGNLKAKTSDGFKLSKGVYHNVCKFYVSPVSGGGIDVDFKVCKTGSTSECKDLTITSFGSAYRLVHTAILDGNNDGVVDTKDSDEYTVLAVKYGRGFFLEGENQLSMKVDTNAYYLEDISGNGFTLTKEQGCDLSQLDEDLHGITVLKEFNKQLGASQVPFGKVWNYVWGVVEAQSSNVIVRNGVSVYVQQVGQYCPIKEAVDGQKYVDINDCRQDSSIECVPSNLYVCNSDATLRDEPGSDVEGQDCSILRGVPSDIYLQKDENTVCLFKCVDGEVKATDCVDKVFCGSGQIYDSEHNKCVVPGVTAPEPKDTGSGECEDFKAIKTPLGEWNVIPDFECIFGNPLDMIKFLGSMIMAVLVFAVSLTLGRKYFKKKKDQAIVWIITILLTLLVFALLMYIFWVGVIAVAVILVVRWIVGMVNPFKG